MARILVVDDDEHVRALVTRLLQLHGHEVETAVDGAEAIDLIREKRYDLMIIDRLMPNMNGIDTVTMIRSNPEFNYLKILMFTQTSLTKNVDEAFEAGVDGYILKPIDMDRLIGKIASTLENAT